MLRITRRSPSAEAYPKRDVRAVAILLRPLNVERRHRLDVSIAQIPVIARGREENGSIRPEADFRPKIEGFERGHGAGSRTLCDLTRRKNQDPDSVATIQCWTDPVDCSVIWTR
jgi:hypothetical protein